MRIVVRAYNNKKNMNPIMWYHADAMSMILSLLSANDEDDKQDIIDDAIMLDVMEDHDDGEEVEYD